MNKIIEFYKNNRKNIKYAITVILLILTIFFLIRGIFFPGENSRIGYFFLFVIFSILSVITYFSTVLLGSKK